MQNISVMKTILLCGGEGTRLHPLTKKIPKSLVKIKDKAIIDYIIAHLTKHDLDEFLICSGYKSNMIEKHFKNKPIKTQIINSGTVDILQRIKDCKNFIDDEFLVCYGDTIANVNINNLLEFHRSHSGVATISSYELRQNFGIIKKNKDNLVLSFNEKPRYPGSINIGYFIFDKKIFKYVQTAHSWLDLILNLTEEKQLFSFKHEGIHITINTLNELASAEKSIDSYLDTF